MHTCKQTQNECPSMLLNIGICLFFMGNWKVGAVLPYVKSVFRSNLVQITLFSLLKSFTTSPLQKSEQVSNELKVRRGLSPSCPFRPWYDAETWDRAVKEQRNYLARQTQENKFSPDNTCWLSTWMTMEHDKDKCRLPPPESLIYQKQ